MATVSEVIIHALDTGRAISARPTVVNFRKPVTEVGPEFYGGNGWVPSASNPLKITVATVDPRRDILRSGFDFRTIKTYEYTLVEEIEDDHVPSTGVEARVTEGVEHIFGSTDLLDVLVRHTEANAVVVSNGDAWGNGAQGLVRERLRGNRYGIRHENGIIRGDHYKCTEKVFVLER